MTNNLFLKPNEAKFLALATTDLLEALKLTAKDVKTNWTPEARKQFKEMIEAGNSLRSKLCKLGFDMSDIPPFEDGDETEFLTKES